ncbi:hypothetical protein E2562_023263 [Oryza meyeriana var. granulata]|uniref:Uncharacterized protein n=1 Tax=Oryza meyeriana var. granulata TaxID=110450 RepID=A0A6G1DM95_9ORYZ|nr:hypothetical protein E2562_023263 [Oryza meyeriana var. granulata]
MAYRGGGAGRGGGRGDPGCSAVEEGGGGALVPYRPSGFVWPLPGPPQHEAPPVVYRAPMPTPHAHQACAVLYRAPSPTPLQGDYARAVAVIIREHPPLPSLAPAAQVAPMAAALAPPSSSEFDQKVFMAETKLVRPAAASPAGEAVALFSKELAHPARRGYGATGSGKKAMIEENDHFFLNIADNNLFCRVSSPSSSSRSTYVSSYTAFSSSSCTCCRKPVALRSIWSCTFSIHAWFAA